MKISLKKELIKKELKILVKIISFIFIQLILGYIVYYKTIDYNNEPILLTLFVLFTFGVLYSILFIVCSLVLLKIFSLLELRYFNNLYIFTYMLGKLLIKIKLYEKNDIYVSELDYKKGYKHFEYKMLLKDNNVF